LKGSPVSMRRAERPHDGHAQASYRPTGRHPRRPPEAGWRGRGWRGSARAVAIERGLRRPYFFLICSPFSQSRRIGRLGWQSRPSCGRDFSGLGLRPRFAATPANDGILGPDGGSILRCPRYHSMQPASYRSPRGGLLSTPGAPGLTARGLMSPRRLVDTTRDYRNSLRDIKPQRQRERNFLPNLESRFC
jgi:hypothetical protein